MPAGEKLAAAAAAAPDPGSVRIWDPFVRVFHWSLAGSIAAAWLTHEGGGTTALVHQVVGYVALGLLAARIVWGFVARSEHARFATFVRAPGPTWAYAKALAAGRDERHLGHNPLGAWMIVALIATAAVSCLSGWLYTTDAYWGVEWVGELHDGSSNLLLALIALHLCGVAFTSLQHGENLVGAMLHGRKLTRDR